MKALSGVAVYCGASMGDDPLFSQRAHEMGVAIAEAGCELVYGGGAVGLMGRVADGAIDAGGRVYGVITEELRARELDHAGLHELAVVETMHERKALMAQRSDAVVMLPGGIGTLDEFMEALTWTQLGVHDKPCGILNVAGYYDGLLEFLHHAVEHGFLEPELIADLVVEDEPRLLLERLATMPRRRGYLPDVPKP